MRDQSPKIVTSYEAQEALVRKFFERRNVQLFEGVRHERHVIAARMAAEGTLNSGGFVITVTSAYVAGFEAFARGLTKDIFDLVHRSGMAMGNATASWIKSQLEPMFEVAAKNMVSEAAQGRVLPDELRQHVDRAMDKSLAEMKRDVGIELDLALPRDDDRERDLSRGTRGGADGRDREPVDPRDVFTSDVYLPRGLERERVEFRGVEYTLRGSETHDAQVYRAYLRTAEKLQEQGANVRRIVIDNELKSEYQRFLQEHNRGKKDSDGRPDRTPEEIHLWALEHNLPEEDGHVQFPDARIEYDDRDGQLRTLDLEVETIHYRGGHLRNASRSMRGSAIC